VKVRENQFVLFSPGTKGEKIVFEKGQPYRGIEILCDPEKLHELMNKFPGIGEYLGDGKSIHFPAKKAGMGSGQSPGYGE
jgi:hypothetical protein